MSNLIPARHLLFLVPANALLLTFLVVWVFGDFSLTNLNWAITNITCLPELNVLVESSIARYTLAIFAASGALLQQVGL